ncbi:MAG: acyl carrier protein [Candidatus Sericytochromatia bacterium]|nr:MAG: acyl carrier protein [Candidatus Sericytochromatia bacterium]
MNSNEIFNKVVEILQDKLQISDKEINLNSHIINDLGADSLDVVELNMALEDAFKEYNLSIPDEEGGKLLTVSKIVEYIEKNIFNNK